MSLENSKSAPQFSATSVQSLLYTLETESAKDTNKGQKVTRRGAFSQFKRVRKLREELLEKGFQTTKASNFKEALKAKLAEISARQIFENIKRLLHSNLKVQNENNERKDRADHRIRLLLDDIADTQTRSTIQYSDNETVWMACAAPQSLMQALDSELESAGDAQRAASREDNQHFVVINRAWDAQKNAISRQLSALGKIKCLGKIFRFINAIILPLASLATTMLVPAASLIAVTAMKTVSEVLLKIAEYLVVKPISKEAENSKQHESIEENASQNRLEQAKQEAALESNYHHRRQNVTNTLEDILRAVSEF